MQSLKRLKPTSSLPPTPPSPFSSQIRSTVDGVTSKDGKIEKLAKKTLSRKSWTQNSRPCVTPCYFIKNLTKNCEEQRTLIAALCANGQTRNFFFFFFAIFLCFLWSIGERTPSHAILGMDFEIPPFLSGCFILASTSLLHFVLGCPLDLCPCDLWILDLWPCVVQICVLVGSTIDSCVRYFQVFSLRVWPTHLHFLFLLRLMSVAVSSLTDWCKWCLGPVDANYPL